MATVAWREALPPEPAGLRPRSLELVSERLEELLDKRPRRDRLQRDDEGYRWCVRSAFFEGRKRGLHGVPLPFRTTIAQMAIGIGYPADDEDEALLRWKSTVKRILRSLRDAGLIRYRALKGGDLDRDGGYVCLEIELVLDERDCSITHTM